MEKYKLYNVRAYRLTKNGNPWGEGFNYFVLAEDMEKIKPFLDSYFKNKPYFSDCYDVSDENTLYSYNDTINGCKRIGAAWSQITGKTIHIFYTMEYFNSLFK